MALLGWQAWWKGAVKHFPGRDFRLVTGHFFQMAKAHVTDGQDLAVWILDGLGLGILTLKAWNIEPLREVDRLYGVIARKHFQHNEKHRCGTGFLPHRYLTLQLLFSKYVSIWIVITWLKTCVRSDMQSQQNGSRLTCCFGFGGPLKRHLYPRGFDSIIITSFFSSRFLDSVWKSIKNSTSIVYANYLAEPSAQCFQ